MSHVYKGYASTYHVRILKYFNPELQLNNAESASKNILIDLLSQLRGFKFVIALALEFKKIKGDDETKYSAFYSNSKAKPVINENDIDNVFESIFVTIISNISKRLKTKGGKRFKLGD